MIVSVLIVTALSVIAETHGPKIAGILAGYPTGTAITLFFFGLEIDPAFASSTVPYNLLGVIATQVFIYLYYLTSNKLQKNTIVIPSLFAIAGYFVAVYLLSFIHTDIYLSTVLIAISTIIFIQLFKKIENTKIKDKIALDNKTLLLRALIAATIIIIITEMAKVIGPQWAGLISSFPATVFPLILIIHLTYKKEHVYSIIKNIPIGNISLVFYSLAVAITYQLYGVYIGTIISLIICTIVALIVNELNKIVNKANN